MHGDRDAVRAFRRLWRTLPSPDLDDDPDYRRLRYVRYCDDFLLGFAGPRREAEEINFDPRFTVIAGMADIVAIRKINHAG
jgi:hypothetical protein